MYLNPLKSVFLSSRKVSHINISTFLAKWVPSVSEMSLPFVAEYEKRGVAKCKKCKEKLTSGILRIGKIMANPFGDGEMKAWHHLDCIFDTFLRARPTTKIIEIPTDDVEGFSNLTPDDQTAILKKVEEHEAVKGKKTPKKNTPVKKQKEAVPSGSSSSSAGGSSVPSEPASSRDSKDNSFRQFRQLCAKIANVDSYLSKTQIVSEYLTKGSNGEKFEGDYKLWVRSLLPGVIKRVYNLQSRQLLKLFSNIFGTSVEEMMEDLEKGDVAETVKVFFESATYVTPSKNSTLTLKEVDDLLDQLSHQTKEDAQTAILRKMAKLATSNDLKMIVRLIKGDLRINAGAKHILDAVHSDAYEAFKSTKDLQSVLDQVMSGAAKQNGSLNMSSKVMTPVQPMLAEACRSIEQAMKKCPNGMFAEIKYDGERVQVHKEGDQFRYYSRSLKPVMAHKVAHFKEFLPTAFPHGDNLILDCEVLLIDTNTAIPLPFGSLGAHKKEKFKDACVCLFVFDCIHLNGEDLMNKTIVERRRILEENMVEVKNRIVFSEMKEVHQASHLAKMIDKVLQQGLEGLVLKDLKSVYKPGKRHWLKVKKDYLKGGSMADSADLVVLGAWYGTGKKGGMMSVFLMGCYDSFSKKWCTVTKVHTGFDDATLEELQTELDMVKISQNSESVPHWLNCSKGLVPDFVTKDPKNSPVWEVSGAEFTKNNKHTAVGISIRFPRVTKQRPDKNWKNATDLTRLKELYEKSKEHTDVVGLKSDSEGSSNEMDSSPCKSTTSPIQPKKTKQTTLSFKRKRNDSTEENESHHKVTRKSSITEDVHQNSQFVTTNPLPDVFRCVKMYIPKHVPESKKLKRHFVAYGGTVLKKHSSEHTHTLTSKAGESPNNAVQEVDVQWLWDSIKLKKRQLERFYPMQERK